jgi:hypothetical protein
MMNINFILPKKTSTVTKRKILSTVASFFDPLGKINPIIVLAKIFLQHLWRLKIDWDESLPMEYQTQWERFCQQLPLLESLKIPRLVRTAGTATNIELHGFSDASLQAYGCCIYMRSINTSSEITVKLLCAKSKVAPIKTLSLAKLELCGAHS